MTSRIFASGLQGEPMFILGNPCIFFLGHPNTNYPKVYPVCPRLNMQKHLENPMGFPQKMIHLHHPPQGFTVENANIKQLEEFEESSTSETEVFHLRESMSVWGLAKMAKMEMHLHVFCCDPNVTMKRHGAPKWSNVMRDSWLKKKNMNSPCGNCASTSK